MKTNLISKAVVMLAVVMASVMNSLQVQVILPST